MANNCKKTNTYRYVYLNKHCLYFECLVGNDDSIKPNCELNDKVSIFIGDIVTLQIDAIVNAANRSLQGGK
jgi:hypothetical protein